MDTQKEKDRLAKVLDWFRRAMRNRLEEQVDAGYVNWDVKEALSNEILISEMEKDIQLLRAGEMKEIDIANRAMMLWARRSIVLPSI